MPEPNSSSTPLARVETWRALTPLISIAALALFSTGLLIRPKVPSTARPPETLPSLAASKSATVDLRLWQDPFAAVEDDWAQHRDDKATAAQPTWSSLHEFSQLRNKVARLPAESRLLVMPVVVPGTWYQRDREERRRARFAVCAALQSCSYVPVDSTHISYCLFEPKASDLRPESCETTPNAATPPPPASVLLPFELFRYDPDNRVLVLVLWLRDDQISEDPGRSLQALKKGLLAGPTEAEPPACNARFLVIGPRSSDTLTALLAGPPLDLPPLCCIAATPTIPDEELPRKPGERKGVCCVRTTPTDERMAKLLVGELWLRGVDLARDPVVLLCEYDRRYTRTLHRVFARTLAEGAGKQREGLSARSYLFEEEDREKVALAREKDRGTPVASETTVAKAARVTDAAPAKLFHYAFFRGLEGEKREEKPTALSAEETQVDYVMALARQIQDDVSAEGGGPRAIGIFGVDIFDRLLLMRVLRPVFPQALFFSVDLDSHLFDPAELPSTRNLLVAAQFGLTLDLPSVAGGAERREFPPMRGSAQTAVACAARLAVDAFTRRAAGKDEEIAGVDSDEGLLGEVDRGFARMSERNISGVRASLGRIFEVGANGLVDLSSTTGDATPRWRDLALLAVVPLLFFLLAHTATWSATSVVRPLDSKSLTWRKRWPILGTVVVPFIVPFLLASSILLALASHDGASGTGEPFLVWSGVSTWPTVFLYVWSTCFAAAFLFWSSRKVTLTYRALRRLMRGLDGKEGPNDPFGVRPILDTFMQRVQPRKTFWRVLRLLATYAVITVLLFFVWGRPTRPSRGPLNQVALITAIVVAVVSLHALLFFVLDVTRQALKACRQMRERLVGLQRALLDAVGSPQDRGPTLKVVLQATKELSTGLEWMVRGPFVSLAIMILARSARFDRFDWPTSLVVIISLSALLALLNGQGFGRSIAEVRGAAVRYLELWLNHYPLIHPTGRPTADAIALWHRHRELHALAVGDVRRGAFSWLSGPTVEALLLSAGSFWLVQLLEPLGSRQ